LESPATVLHEKRAVIQVMKKFLSFMETDIHPIIYKTPPFLAALTQFSLVHPAIINV
jgi:hypothetical protein